MAHIPTPNQFRTTGQQPSPPGIFHYHGGFPQRRSSSLRVNQPGVYGRIDIGNFPQPQVVYAQPVLIAPPVHYVQQQPVYLYVPPGHQKNWRKYCGRYQACGQPVYFVKERWVRERYEDRRRHGGGDSHGYDGDRGHDQGRGHGKKDKGGHDH